MQTSDLIYYTDPQGRQIAIVSETTSRLGKVFHVEVVDAGEVVDHFMLIGESALTLTAARKGWQA
jgi:hypothetical protein